MFWDQVAGVYDIFVNVINRKTHRKLKKIVSALIEAEDDVLECACGTGLLSTVIAQKCRTLSATDFSFFRLFSVSDCFENQNNQDYEKADKHYIRRSAAEGQFSIFQHFTVWQITHCG